MLNETFIPSLGSLFEYIERFVMFENMVGKIRIFKTGMFFNIKKNKREASNALHSKKDSYEIEDEWHLTASQKGTSKHLAPLFHNEKVPKAIGMHQWT